MTNETLMEEAFKEAKLSKCLRRNIGAVISFDGEILVRGHNFPINNQCNVDGFCFREKNNILSGTRPNECYAIHAEMKCLLELLKKGVNPKDCSLFVTNKPCSICSRLIIEVGLKEVFYRDDYPDPFTDGMFLNSNVKLTKI